MQEVQFRGAREDDLPEMAHLFTKKSPAERLERMRRRYQKAPRGWHVAVKNNRVLACCQVVFPCQGDAWLQWMRVSPDVQGGGIGGAFSDYVERQAIAEGAQVIRLNTMTTNDRVHHMMGGGRGYTEWARWIRLTDLQRESARELMRSFEVSRATDSERAAEWLHTQPGYQRSFAAATCPTDFKVTISLDEAMLRRLNRSKGSTGCIIAERAGEIEGVALYAGKGKSMRVLQVVAETTEGGLAACAGALRKAGAQQSLSIQYSGVTRELSKALWQQFRRGASCRHDFYVFGKRV